MVTSPVLTTTSNVFQYQWCQPQGPQSSAVAPSAADLQRRVRQAQQGLHQHAQDR